MGMVQQGVDRVGGESTSGTSWMHAFHLSRTVTTLPAQLEPCRLARRMQAHHLEHRLWARILRRGQGCGAFLYGPWPCVATLVYGSKPWRMRSTWRAGMKKALSSVTTLASA